MKKITIGILVFCILLLGCTCIFQAHNANIRQNKIDKLFTYNYMEFISNGRNMIGCTDDELMYKYNAKNAEYSAAMNALLPLTTYDLKNGYLSSIVSYFDQVSGYNATLTLTFTEEIYDALWAVTEDMSSFQKSENAYKLLADNVKPRY